VLGISQGLGPASRLAESKHYSSEFKGLEGRDTWDNSLHLIPVHTKAHGSLLGAVTQLWSGPSPALLQSQQQWPVTARLSESSLAPSTQFRAWLS